MSLVTTKEAAQVLGVTPVRVRQLIKDGREAQQAFALLVRVRGMRLGRIGLAGVLEK